MRIFIDEDLTGLRARVCRKLREDEIHHHTRDGKVFLLVAENEYKVLDSPKDWDELDWSDEFKTLLGIYPKD